MRKLFRDKLDTSVLDYINSIRIDNAKRLLKGTELTIQDIATKVGYQNIQSFNRFFKKFEGISPKEFRRI
jgi:YesN/AraC family two-component response regulator